MPSQAIDILTTRSKKDKDQGWYLMSEAASIGACNLPFHCVATTDCDGGVRQTR